MTPNVAPNRLPVVSAPWSLGWTGPALGVGLLLALNLGGLYWHRQLELHASPVGQLPVTPPTEIDPPDNPIVPLAKNPEAKPVLPEAQFVPTVKPVIPTPPVVPTTPSKPGPMTPLPEIDHTTTKVDPTITTPKPAPKTPADPTPPAIPVPGPVDSGPTPAARTTPMPMIPVPPPVPQKPLTGRVLVLVLATPELKQEYADRKPEGVRHELEQVVSKTRENLIGGNIFVYVPGAELPQSIADISAEKWPDAPNQQNNLSTQWNAAFASVEKFAQLRVEEKDRDFRLFVIWRSDEFVASGLLPTPFVNNSSRKWQFLWTGGSAESEPARDALDRWFKAAKGGPALITGWTDLSADNKGQLIRLLMPWCKVASPPPMP